LDLLQNVILVLLGWFFVDECCEFLLSNLSLPSKFLI